MRFARETVGATSATLFLVERGTDKLYGLVSEWDWTRTSFESSLRRWPTVERALESGDLYTISKTEALGAEVEWFGPRGVIRTVCVPLRTEDRHIGVLFFDFDTESSERETDFSFLEDVGNRCARAIARQPRDEPSRVETPLAPWSIRDWNSDIDTQVHVARVPRPLPITDEL